MKTNEAPEKIYLFENPITGTPDDRWLSKRSGDTDVEYTRTDVFIEKAYEFIKERIVFDDNTWYIEGEVTLKDKVIEDFKKYIKGE